MSFDGNIGCETVEQLVIISASEFERVRNGKFGEQFSFLTCRVTCIDGFVDRFPLIFKVHLTIANTRLLWGSGR